MPRHAHIVTGAASAPCSGNLLGDTALLSSLNDTKAKASTVSAALEDGKKLAAQLDQQRSAYRYSPSAPLYAVIVCEEPAGLTTQLVLEAWVHVRLGS